MRALCKQRWKQNPFGSDSPPIQRRKKARRPIGRLAEHPNLFSYRLLAEMPQPIFAHEGGAGPANESTAVAIGAVIAVVSVGVGAERRRCDRTGRSDRAADHAGSDITRPEPAVSMSLRPLLLMLNS